MSAGLDFCWLTAVLVRQLTGPANDLAGDSPVGMADRLWAALLVILPPSRPARQPAGSAAK